MYKKCFFFLKDLNQVDHKLASDVNEGRTVFLRNLSFDVTQDMLEKEMESFGKFNYCLVSRKVNLM